MVDKQFVSIPVPADRVEEVYEVLGRPRRVAPEVEPAPDVPPEADVEQPLDEALVIRAYRESPQGMKLFFDYLADNPERSIQTAEVAEGIGRKPNQLAGILGAYGRRKKNRYRMEGTWPYEAWWDWDNGHAVYRMSTEVAEVIIKARNG